MRTCVACRTSRPKRELVRVVALAAGGVVVDETGKQNGRGAYLCRQKVCWVQGLARGTLGRALHTALTSEELATLRAYADLLPETLGDAPEALDEGTLEDAPDAAV